MDKPLGPRQPPPDKRHAAYESIFGRPNPPPQPYPAYPPHNAPYPYPDRRTSYNPPPQGLVYQHGQQRQTYYPHQQQQSLPMQPQFPPFVSPYQQFQPSLAPPPHQPLSRGRSINSNSSEYVASHPGDLEPQQGLTPAQAYQAQIYTNAPNSAQSPWPGPSRLSAAPSTRSAAPTHDLPRIGISLEHDDGRLGVDFSSGEQDDSSSGSELPWARSEPSIPMRQQTLSRQHLRQPSASDPVHPVIPLHVDTFSPRSSIATASPSPGSGADHSVVSSTLVDHNSNRRSSDSARTMPKFTNNNNQRRDRTSQDRSMSMSAVRPLTDPKRTSGRTSPTSIRAPPVRKTPIVYPALLSRVAQAFRDRIPITDRVKDGLTYKDSFDGREAVDKIAYIIKTTDRNLALLLGRALDAQKFFHDVTYDHRLRDSANELYQFQTKMPSPFVSGELQNGQGTHPNALNSAHFENSNSFFEGDHDSPSPSPLNQVPKDSLNTDEIALPSGVFTLLTDCYSPTCSRDQLCYSIACPRRLEQQARLNMKPQPGLSKQISKDSLNDVPDAGTLWIHSVPQEIVNSVSDTEKKRQEAINEVIYTERDFVRDLEYLRDVWISKLKEEDIIPMDRRMEFLTRVFWNIHDIIAVNTRLRDALSKRQKQYAVVDRIGDIFLDVVPHFRPFVSYGAHQLYGKYEFEKEKNTNPAFAQFVETTERLPESRKLELNAYLTKPTTRLARYPLLLEAVLKHTPNDSSDKKALPEVISIVRDFLAKVNTETGKAENRFNLLQLDQQLVFRPGEEVDLRLREEGREMVYKGGLNKRDGEIQVYLFDHALLFTKQIKTKQHEQYKVYRRPIPLELLLITAAPIEENTATVRSQQRKTQALVRKSSFDKGRGVPGVVSAVAIKGEKGQHWINFIHLGRKFYNLMLWSSSPVTHRKWLEVIYKQQQIMKERSVIFDTVTLSEGFFSGPNKVNCAAPYSGGRRVVYGTDDGVYLSDLREPNQEPVKVLALLDVLQVDVLEDYQLLIVLSERQVITFPLEALDPLDPMAGLKRAKRISSHTSFFKAGFCLNRVLVCIVKSSQLSSTFKTLEPIDQNIRGRAKPTFKKLLQGGNDTLKPFREFYIPVESTSIHYLKTKMCVGCSRGFEIVDLESLDTQGLLDPNDEMLEFVRKKENLRPMAIYRIHNDFLLCYDEFAFYVNKSGRRSRKDFMVHWEGTPTGFALHEPYVLAFEPTFVEVRHIDTGLMSQVIQGSNLRLLFADTPPSVTNSSTLLNQQNMIYNNPYGQYPGHPHHPYPDQYPRHPQGVGRDEILIVSDDRVLALRPRGGAVGTTQNQRYMPDNLSMSSIPR
ncbi:Rho1 guanine nucleotide exchange factor 1 [Psilocybe cubensis]|uniref:Rho1 guanine nucleotide exchange factor 1 n=1 Tax=Psilocybe cubensis TaxID=181762 RepID=A0ACB8GVC5_PSICU|nr:Rho1 guanine nucleotide exchange factor 1 [Psilocybe cubensis]KAH9479544.1 Rho1 guanine nucleotide exchange factor 1 [Psilocybe cubensis]